VDPRHAQLIRDPEFQNVVRLHRVAVVQRKLRGAARKGESQGGGVFHLPAFRQTERSGHTCAPPACHSADAGKVEPRAKQNRRETAGFEA